MLKNEANNNYQTTDSLNYYILNLNYSQKLLIINLTLNISHSDKQHHSISGSSCVDLVFILRQIEKSTECNKPAFLCFINFTKALTV